SARSATSQNERDRVGSLRKARSTSLRDCAARATARSFELGCGHDLLRGGAVIASRNRSMRTELIMLTPSPRVKFSTHRRIAALQRNPYFAIGYVVNMCCAILRCFSDVATKLASFRQPGSFGGSAVLTFTSPPDAVCDPHWL